MLYNRFSYRILCEDRAHYNFVFGFLSEKGVNPRKIIPAIPFAEGVKGDAQDYVCGHFPDQCRRIRISAAKTKSLLIVVCDADPEKQKKGQPAPSEDKAVEAFNQAYGRFQGAADTDPVFIIVASRNIETWLNYLRNPEDAESAKEIPDHKKIFDAGDATLYGKKMAGRRLNDPGETNNIPASLKLTIEKAGMKKNNLKRKWPDAF